MSSSGDRGERGGRGSDRGQRGPEMVVNSPEPDKIPEKIRQTSFFLMYPELDKALTASYSDDVCLMVRDVFRRIVRINLDLDVAWSRKELYLWLSEARLDIVRYEMDHIKALKDPLFTQFIQTEEPKLVELEDMLLTYSMPEGSA